MMIDPRALIDPNREKLGRNIIMTGKNNIPRFSPEPHCKDSFRSPLSTLPNHPPKRPCIDIKSPEF
jgi:hypothetical protein